jgi:hypothetical protein
MRILRSTLAAVLSVGLIPLAGCDSGANNGAEPPVLAPGAFQYDPTFPEAAGGGGANWTNAALRVGVVTLAVGAHLFIPAAATSAATQDEPTVVDGTWIWENTVPINNVPVTFRLEGTPAGQEITWRMLISANQAIDGAIYDEFELYDATTTLDGRTGDWRLYYLIEDVRTHVLSADFDVDSEQVADVTYSIPDTNPNTGARGSTVLYARDGEARTFDWHQEPEDFDHLVQWSAATNAGSLTATNYNGGERACWDASLADVPCEPALVP